MLLIRGIRPKSMLAVVVCEFAWTCGYGWRCWFCQSQEVQVDVSYLADRCNAQQSFPTKPCKSRTIIPLLPRTPPYCNCNMASKYAALPDLVHTTPSSPPPPRLEPH